MRITCYVSSVTTFQGGSNPSQVLSLHVAGIIVICIIICTSLLGVTQTVQTYPAFEVLQSLGYFKIMHINLFEMLLYLFFTEIPLCCFLIIIIIQSI
jgi:hypothetical protein